MGYFALVIVSLAIGGGVSAYVKHMLNKYKSVRISSGMSGYQYAQRMLAANGLYNVQIRLGGPDQDHFDPRTNTIALSPDAYYGTSVTAAATACHEVGHACQHAYGYTPMKIRSAIVPAVNICSNAWIFVLIIGIVLNMIELALVAVILYAAVVVFQLVTLPVEFNASARGLAYLRTQPLMVQETDGSSKVLRACALTYVAAALISVLQLLWILGQARD